MFSFSNDQLIVFKPVSSAPSADHPQFPSSIFMYSFYPQFSCNAMSESSRPEVFCKKGVLRNFAKFTGKHLCQGLFFNKVAGLRLFFSLYYIQKRISSPMSLCLIITVTSNIMNLLWVIKRMMKLIKNDTWRGIK